MMQIKLKNKIKRGLKPLQEFLIKEQVKIKMNQKLLLKNKKKQGESKMPEQKIFKEKLIDKL